MKVGIRRMVRLNVEVPVNDYIKMVLLLLNGDYQNLKEIIWEGLKRVFKDYSDEFFEKLKEENEDIINNILSNVKIVERKAVRRWIVKE